MTRAEAERREQIAMAICGAAVLHCIPCICKRDGRSPASCTAPACNDALRAADAVLALPDTEEADGWRDGTAAPRDGSEIWVKLPGDGRVRAYWDDELRTFVLSRPLHVESVSEPAGWLPPPLPEPPNTGEG